MPVWFRRAAARRLLPFAPMAVTVFSGGCYSYGPMPSTTPAGQRTSVELMLNERGRADLVDRLGPDALTLEGDLVTRNDSALTINVRSVRYINQSVTKWTGETLALTSGQLRDIRLKRFSVAKTSVAVGSALAGVLVFIITRTLSGAGDNPPPGGGGGGNPS